MGRVVPLVERLLLDESGMELVEMTILTALLVAAIVVALSLLSTAITNRYGEVMQLI